MGVSKKLKITATVVVFIFVVVVCGIFYVLYKFNSPTYGSISVPDVTTSKPAGIDFTPKYISGQYASFSYPSGLQVKPSSASGGSTLAVYMFSYHDIEDWNLVVTIYNYPTGTLMGNSAYLMRKLNPATYSESAETINNKPVDIMTDNTAGGFSKVAFLINGQYQATISLYGDDSNGMVPLQRTLDMIIKSWMWLVG